MDLDAEQQMALNAILVPAHQNSLPILISGPFGTGKTRIMALAAHMHFQRAHSACILVCTQQRESADNFMLMYREVVSKSGSDDVNVTNIILRDYGYRRRELQKFYIKPEELSRCLRNSKDNMHMLVVTTCLTAHHLVDENINFTCIFVDEGAQMREPEAIAALRMANKMTTLVIAGDPQQVGPAMLVFGEEAKKGGLNKSLLERLVLEYKEMDKNFESPVSQNYHITLATNYRCHDDIRKLSARLFYREIPPKSPLKPNDQPGAFGFHGSQSSIHFMCSSIMDNEQQSGVVNEAEATSVVNLLVEILQSWPRYGGIKAGDFDPWRVCIMSKSRSQLRTIRSLISKRRVSKELQRVRCVPTYAMQGNEYCVLILSTWEPLKPDGSPEIDSSKSLCDPYVFNTAITRAESLVVAVGNPISLLKTEKHMIRDPNYKDKGKCWSNFLKHCIENDTLTFSKSLKSPQEKEACLVKIKEIAGDHLGKPIKCIPPDQRPHVTILEENFEVECRLGAGSYGVVLKVKRLKTDKRTYAIKLKICTKDEKRTLKEAEKLQKLQDKNIVRYYDSGFAKFPDWEDWKEWLQKTSRFGQSLSSGSSTHRDFYPGEPLCFFILTEVCDGGTLRDWLRKNKDKEDRSRPVIRDFLDQILQALKYIHKQNLAHRDLKPSNIFFTSDNTLKVGDFGFVKDMDDDHCATEQTVTFPSEDRSLSKNYGTEYYRSPEVVNRQSRNAIDWMKVDIFAVGVIFFELCWSFEDRERDKIMRKLLPKEAEQKPALPEKFTEEHCSEAAELILLMTSYDHTHRPCAKNILKGNFQSFSRKVNMYSKKKNKRKVKSSSIS